MTCFQSDLQANIINSPAGPGLLVFFLRGLGESSPASPGLRSPSFEEFFGAFFALPLGVPLGLALGLCPPLSPFFFFPRGSASSVFAGMALLLKAKSIPLLLILGLVKRL